MSAITVFIQELRQLRSFPRAGLTHDDNDYAMSALTRCVPWRFAQTLVISKCIHEIFSASERREVFSLLLERPRPSKRTLPRGALQVRGELAVALVVLLLPILGFTFSIGC